MRQPERRRTQEKVIMSTNHTSEPPGSDVTCDYCECGYEASWLAVACEIDTLINAETHQ